MDEQELKAKAFGMDTACMIIGYLFFLPKIIKQARLNNPDKVVYVRN